MQILVNNLGIQFQTTPIPCAGGPGLISATGFGGSGQYGYAWSGGQSTVGIEALLPGYYSLTLSDLSGTGCIASDTVLLEISGTLEVEGIAHSIQCFGALNGNASASPLNGTAPFTWLWNTGQTVSSLNGLGKGTYTVTVTDAIGCQGTEEILVTEPPILMASAKATDFVLCPNESTTIMAIVAGGTPPYAFLWDNGLMDSILMQMPAGNYMLSVTDRNGCQGLAFLEITAEPSIVILLDSVDHASGPTTADGSIMVTVSGGTAPLSFKWSNGSTAQDLNGVLPGTYTLTVTDAGGCTQTYSAQVDFKLATHGQVNTAWNAFILPNPAEQGSSATLVIESPGDQSISLQLVDATGRLIFAENVELRSDHYRRAIQTPAAAGVYFWVIRNGWELRCLKWVVVD